MEFVDMLKEFTAAVEGADGRRLAALFTEDGTYHDTFYGEFRGRDAIADMLENLFWRDARDFRWDMREPIATDQRAYARWIFSYSSNLPEASGRRVLFEGMSRFELKDDQISHYAEIFDTGIALAQTNFEPERIAKIVTRAGQALRERHAGSRHLA
jgi:hypothetical protein